MTTSCLQPDRIKSSHHSSKFEPGSSDIARTIFRSCSMVPENKEQSTKDVHFMIDLRTWSMVLQKVLQSTEPHKEPRKNITTKGTRKEPA